MGGSQTEVAGLRQTEPRRGGTEAGVGATQRGFETYFSTNKRSVRRHVLPASSAPLSRRPAGPTCTLPVPCPSSVCAPTIFSLIGNPSSVPLARAPEPSLPLHESLHGPLEPALQRLQSNISRTSELPPHQLSSQEGMARGVAWRGAAPWSKLSPGYAEGPFLTKSGTNFHQGGLEANCVSLS